MDANDDDVGGASNDEVGGPTAPPPPKPTAMELGRGFFFLEMDAKASVSLSLSDDEPLPSVNALRGRRRCTIFINIIITSTGPALSVVGAGWGDCVLGSAPKKCHVVAV